LVDSLVASSLAAKTNSPIALYDSNGDGSISSAYASKLGSSPIVTALGGTAVVPDVILIQVAGVHSSSNGGGFISDSATPSAIAVTGVSLNKPTLSLTPGGATGPLVATVSPANATNQAVTWTTSNADVAAVVNGVVTPLKTGTAIITATTDDGAKTAACTVSVTPITSGDLGAAGDLSGFTQYYPLLAGNAAPAATLKWLEKLSQ